MFLTLYKLDTKKGLHLNFMCRNFKADKQLLEVAKEVLKNFDNHNKVVFGRMVTGEKFIEDEKRDFINNNFSPLSVDMETASIAHVCHVNKIPFVAVRSITDTPDHKGVDAFEENCPKAAQISANFACAMLKVLVERI